MSKCVYCGGHAKSKDHLVPQSKGGGPRANMVPACFACNGMKADMDPAEFFAAYPDCAREFARRAPHHIPREMVSLARHIWEATQGPNLVVGYKRVRENVA